MKTLTAAEMQQIDRITIERYGIPVLLLMDHAGRAVAEATRSLTRDKPVVVLAGGGNNGGDGVAAARYLRNWGYRVDVWWLRNPAQWQGDLALHYTMARHADVHFEPFEKVPLSKKLLRVRRAGAVVDALLGTGTRGEIRSPFADAINFINKTRRPVVAVDIPSGLDSDTGKLLGPCVKARVTVTLAAAKRGLLNRQARPYVGKLLIADIGIPRVLLP